MSITDQTVSRRRPKDISKNWFSIFESAITYKIIWNESVWCIGVADIGRPIVYQLCHNVLRRKIPHIILMGLIPLPCVHNGELKKLYDTRSCWTLQSTRNIHFIVLVRLFRWELRRIGKKRSTFFFLRIIFYPSIITASNACDY